MAEAGTAGGKNGLVNSASKRKSFKMVVETIPLTAASEETPITFVSKEQDCGPGQPGNPLGRRKGRREVGCRDRGSGILDEKGRQSSKIQE